jgi:hypothetical protein
MIIVMYYTSYGFICGVSFHLLRSIAFSCVAFQGVSCVDSEGLVNFDRMEFSVRIVTSKQTKSCFTSGVFVKVGPLTVI